MSFHLLDGNQAGVPTMNQGMHIPYAAGDGWQAVELPYAGETAAMDVLVPDEGNFEQFDSSLDLETATAILASLQPRAVQLSLPKFEFTSQFGLADQLSALGMIDAFDPNRADLSGMTGTRDLYISAVVHKAFVALDEKGTEAAAATAVIVGATGAPLFDVVLTIDRPFILIIRDLKTGQILFLGRVTDPSRK
jgi:serpin B